jgi:osomolarity two-component system sensor histidine kinase NIK1
MVGDFTSLVRAIAAVTTAVALGDLSKQVQTDVQGEMLDLKIVVNAMVNRLSTLANEIRRVSLEVGTEGILGGQATVPHAQGTWKVRKDNRALPRERRTDRTYRR